MIGHLNTLALGFASCITHAIDQRHVSLIQMLCCSGNRLIYRRFFPIDQSVGVLSLRSVVQKPCLPEHTSFLGLMNAFFIRVQLNVITYAPTEGARCMINDFQIDQVVLKVNEGGR